MGFSLFDFARQQVIASIKRDHPDCDVGELRRRLFLRFYGEDFSPEEQEKILEKIWTQNIDLFNSPIDIDKEGLEGRRKKTNQINQTNQINRISPLYPPKKPLNVIPAIFQRESSKIKELPSISSKETP